MKKLLEILTTPGQRITMDTLLKCEAVLEKLDMVSNHELKSEKKQYCMNFSYLSDFLKFDELSFVGDKNVLNSSYRQTELVRLPSLSVSCFLDLKKKFTLIFF